MEDKDFSDGDVNSSDSEDELCGKDDGVGKEVNGADKENAEANIAYLDRLLWRGRNCDLLNDDLSFFGKAKVVVCLSNKPFHEENLRDSDVGVLFLSDEDLQMTSFGWPLAQVRLEGGRLLLDIVMWHFEHAKLSKEDSKLERVSKNPYCHIKQRKLSQMVESKFKIQLIDADV